VPSAHHQAVGIAICIEGRVTLVELDRLDLAIRILFEGHWQVTMLRHVIPKLLDQF
jgi:hypothetical protein